MIQEAWQYFKRSVGHKLNSTALIKKEDIELLQLEYILFQDNIQLLLDY